MADQQFYEAKILYDLFNKSQQPIREDTLNRLIPLLGLSTEPEDLLARLHRLMSGLPVEDEFIALAVWMEKCKLVHKLEQEQFPYSSTEDYQVPDLFAVFDYNDQTIPVLIDVKSTTKDTITSAKFRLSARLYEKLTNYANLVGLPLLIAWKVSGHWALFDIQEMQKHVSAYHIEWEDAWKSDLMFSLLGNINIVPMPGLSLTFTLQDLGPAGHKNEDGEEHIFRYHSIRLSDASGNEINKNEMKWSQFILFISSNHEVKQQWRDDLLDLTFQVIPDPSTLPAYALLPLLLFEMYSENQRPQNWYEAIKNEAFGEISYSEYKEAMNEGIGTFVLYIIQMVPHKYPVYLSEQTN